MRGLFKSYLLNLYCVMNMLEEAPYRTNVCNLDEIMHAVMTCCSVIAFA